MLLQDGEVERCALIFSCENSKITTCCWTTIDRRMLDPTEKKIPHIQGQRRSPRKMVKVKVKSLSHVWLFAAPWTVAFQAPPSIGFSRQEYWSGLPFPSPGDLPNPGIERRSPALQVDSLPAEPPGQQLLFCNLNSVMNVNLSYCGTEYGMWST